MKKLFVAILITACAAVCVLGLSACLGGSNGKDKPENGANVGNEVAFYDGSTRLDDGAIYSYVYGEDVTIAATLTAKTGKGEKLNFFVSYSFSEDWDGSRLPTAGSGIGRYTVSAQANGKSASVYIDITEGVLSSDIFARLAKENGEIYFGDTYSDVSVTVTDGKNELDKKDIESVNYYIVPAEEYAKIPNTVKNKEEYIIENIRYYTPDYLYSLGAGDYYIFASLKCVGYKQAYTPVSADAKFTVNKMPLKIKEAPAMEEYCFPRGNDGELLSGMSLGIIDGEIEIVNNGHGISYMSTKNYLCGGKVEDVYGNVYDMTSTLVPSDDARLEQIKTSVKFEFVNRDKEVTASDTATYPVKLSVISGINDYADNFEVDGEDTVNVALNMKKGDFSLGALMLSRYKYCGREQGPLLSCDADDLIISGDPIKAINAGNYSTVFAPKYPENYAFAWELGAWESLISNCEYAGAEATLNSDGTLTLDWAIEKAGRFDIESLHLADALDVYSANGTCGGNTDVYAYAYEEIDGDSYLCFKIAFNSDLTANRRLMDFNADDALTVRVKGEGIIILPSNGGSPDLTADAAQSLTVRATDEFFVCVNENLYDGTGNCVNVPYEIKKAEDANYRESSIDGFSLLGFKYRAYYNTERIIAWQGTSLAEFIGESHWLDVLEASADYVNWAWYYADEYNENPDAANPLNPEEVILDGEVRLVIAITEYNAAAAHIDGNFVTRLDFVRPELDSLLNSGSATSWASEQMRIESDGVQISVRKEGYVYTAERLGNDLLIKTESNGKTMCLFYKYISDCGYYEVYVKGYDETAFALDTVATLAQLDGRIDINEKIYVSVDELEEDAEKLGEDSLNGTVTYGMVYYQSNEEGKEEDEPLQRDYYATYSVVDVESGLIIESYFYDYDAYAAVNGISADELTEAAIKSVLNDLGADFWCLDRQVLEDKEIVRFSVDVD